MIANKDTLTADMQELEGTVSLYKECFPDNPAFATAGSSKQPKIKNKKVG